MKLGLLTAAFRDLLARRGGRLGGRQRLRDARGRLLARRRAPSSAATRASRTSTSTTLDAGRGARDASSATGSRSPRSPTTRTTCTRTTTHREEVNGHLRKVIDAAQALGVDIVGTFVGNDKDRPLPGEPRALPPDLAGARRLRRRARREDRDRELPDDLLATTSGRAATTSPGRRRSGTRCSRRSPTRTSGSTSTRRISSG